MVAWTVSLAIPAVAMVVCGAALALLLLEHRGTELLGWLSRGRAFGGSRSSIPGSEARAGERSEPGPRGLGAVLAPQGHAARGMELLRVGLGVVWAASLGYFLVPSTGYWSGLVAAHSLYFAWAIALATAYLAVAFLMGVTTRLASAVGAIVSIAFLITQFGTSFAFLGGTGVGPQLLYLAIYASLWVGGAGRLWAVDGALWKRGWGQRVPQARWFASLPPLGAA